MTSAEKFWGLVEVVPDGCWEWKGTRQGRGYGVFYDTNIHRHLSHRFSYALFVGPIPDGMCVCHTCDNPPCVRPDHLFVGTQADNMRDCASKGRSPNGERHWVTTLTISDVRSIRGAYKGKRKRPFQKEIAKSFGVSKQTVSRILRGESWSHAV